MGNLLRILKEEKQLRDVSERKRLENEDKKLHSIRHSQIRCAGNAYGKKTFEYGCGKSSELRLWTLELRQFWDNNTGSPCGGFWTTGTPELDNLICPKCSRINYIYNHPQKAKILTLRKAAGTKEIQIFKTTVESKHGVEF